MSICYYHSKSSLSMDTPRKRLRLGQIGACKTTTSPQHVHFHNTLMAGLYVAHDENKRQARGNATHSCDNPDNRDSGNADQSSKPSIKDDKNKVSYESFVVLLWGMKLILAVFCLIFGLQYYHGCKFRSWFAIFIATYNLLVYFHHLYRRRELSALSVDSKKPLSFIFDSSRARAVATANISFVMYHIIFLSSENFITCVWETHEFSPCLAKLGADLLDKVVDILNLVNPFACSG